MSIPSVTTSSDLTYLKTQCHCGKNSFAIALLTSSLPVSGSICHCNSCRHVSGNTAVYAAPIHGGPLLPQGDAAAASEVVKYTPVDVSKVSTLKAYKTSPAGTRYFCATCAAHFFLEAPGEGGSNDWYVMTGLLERLDGIVKPREHVNVGDTLDGGAADHLIKCYGVSLPRYQGMPFSEAGMVELPSGWKADSTAASSVGGGTEAIGGRRLPFYCHCRKIQFTIKPLEKASSREAEWWLRGDLKGVAATPEKPVQYIAGYCVCKDCRLSSGHIFTSWTFVPEDYMFARAGNGEKEERLAVREGGPGVRLPGLEVYKSSEKIARVFCGTCGSRVWNVQSGAAEERIGEFGGEWVAVNMGNVDEQVAKGAKADKWMHWFNYVHCKESGFDMEIVNALFADPGAEGGA